MSLLNSVYEAIRGPGKSQRPKKPDPEKYFARFVQNTEENLFIGVFDTFEAALSCAPESRPRGYDNTESANIAYASRIVQWDYPALFWLKSSMVDGLHSVFDLGGHVGIKYYAFRRAVAYPPNLRWTVCDVPAVVARGREIAAARAPEGNLSFTDKYSDMDGHEIVYASGSLQYLPITLASMLGDLRRLPKRIIINITPIHPTRSFFTLNSIGTAICAYRVQQRTQFIESIAALGYTKMDEWENAGKGMHLPLEEGYDVDQYSGFCFALNQSS